MFAGLCASLAGVASQAGDADSSRAPGLTSGSWTEVCKHPIAAKQYAANIYIYKKWSRLQGKRRYELQD